MTVEPFSAVYKDFQLTVVNDDCGFQVYLKSLVDPSKDGEVGIGAKIMYGPYADQATAVAAARRAIDIGEAW